MIGTFEQVDPGVPHVRPHRHRVRRPHAHWRLVGRLCRPVGWELGVAIRAAVERAGIAGDSGHDEVLISNCLMAGQGQAPARQAVRFKAGLPDSAGAQSLSKMCGSGMKRGCLATTCCRWQPDVMVAGGMESMTNAPHLMFAAQGHHIGASAVYDHMALTVWRTPTSAARPWACLPRAARCTLHARGHGPVRHHQPPSAKAANEDGSVSGPRWRP